MSVAYFVFHNQNQLKSSCFGSTFWQKFNKTRIARGVVLKMIFWRKQNQPGIKYVMFFFFFSKFTLYYILQNITRNCPGITILNSPFGSFSFLVVLFSFYLVVLSSFCLDTNHIKYLKGLKTQKSFFVSKF